MLICLIKFINSYFILDIKIFNFSIVLNPKKCNMLGLISID